VPQMNDCRVKRVINPFQSVFRILGMVFNLCSPNLAFGADNSVVIQSVEDEFENVRDNVSDAIIGRGMKIANVIHASQMLNRTAADLDIEKNVYLHAESLEFCNAVLSHKLVAANPSNIVLCPFIISIYVLSGNPDVVYIAYKPPISGTETLPVLRQIEVLFRDIVAEALE